MEVEFVSVIVLHIVLGVWCFGDDISNVPAPREEKLIQKKDIILKNYISC